MKFLCNKRVLSSLLAVFFIQGCVQSNSFSPPINGEKVHFMATLPDELDALPISAMYCEHRGTLSYLNYQAILSF
ncbi:hypothetical protein [Xenorhabdus bovienii]|uniref:hypothetical protein n=1 Tax=Xenorhabdus bovienii TaxID=40576 RepID=UPI00056ED92F|nr:hypothetical protein [Xenorhabdus bovienii]